MTLSIDGGQGGKRRKEWRGEGQGKRDREDEDAKMQKTQEEESQRRETDRNLPREDVPTDKVFPPAWYPAREMVVQTDWGG